MRAPRPGRACAGGAGGCAHVWLPFTSAVNHRLLFKSAPTAGIECDPELTCCVKSSRRTDRDAKKDWTGRCIVALPPGSRPEMPWMDGPPQRATSLSLLPRCTQAGGQGSLPSVVATWPRRRLAPVHAPPAEWARAVSWRPRLGVNLLAHLPARGVERAAGSRGLAFALTWSRGLRGEASCVVARAAGRRTRALARATA